ncbi:MAG: succinate dehydrogenase/fumarate reductase flavoprotein subunit [Nitrososphaerales archaeon]
MVDSIEHDLIIVGSGLAGLRAAIEAARVSKDRLSIGVISKVQVMRSHSVSAEGGTAAVLYQEEGDRIESHIYDTVKGSDFLADQDAVEILCKYAPLEIYQLERWGMPWSRRKDGRIAQRPFGGYDFPRATFAGDKVGFFEMQTLYDTALKYKIEFYNEWFASSLIIEDKEFRGLTAIDIPHGNYYSFKAKACIIATGGAGRLYSFSTYGYSSTPDGLDMAYRAKIPLKDMEFVQFHPTGLVPNGILITEGARGDGGILINKEKERFMKRYAPKKLDLAPRDIVCRSMMTEIEQGRGFESYGMKHLLLDLTHLGEEKIKQNLAGIREIVLKFVGIDPIDEPIPVKPVCHYMMGGIDCDINGKTSIKGLWVAGEASCISVHGANRLGANSTSECLVWGRITGEQAALYAMEKASFSLPEDKVKEDEKRIYDGIFRGSGKENPYEIRRELNKIMDENCYIFRKEESLREGIKKVRELYRRAWKHVDDKDKEYNTNFINTLELDSMIRIAEVILVSAYHREECRGSHYRLDYPNRDDKNWLKHTLCFYSEDGPKIDYTQVKLIKYKPEVRVY